MQDHLYFSRLVDRRVVDSRGRPIGTIGDLVVVSGELFPRISGFVITVHPTGTRLFVPVEGVGDLSENPLSLKPDSPEPAPLHLRAGEARLGHTFLDKQIVDTQGVRVVRINDLKLAHIDSDVRLLGADVGFSALLRRMHMDGVAGWLSRPLRRRLVDSVIPWNFVDPLSSDKVHLNVTRGRLQEMRPADLADVLEQLPAAQRQDALVGLSDDQIADTLAETRLDVQRSIIEEMEDERASDILERMAPDDAADLLGDLQNERREDLLERMDSEDRQELTELLAYGKDTAGGLMTTEVVRLPADATTHDAIALLRRLGPDAETIYYLYIVNDAGQLEGTVSLRSLITAAADVAVGALARGQPRTVSVNDDQQYVAEMIARYNLLALPVVDAEGVLKGIVTVDDVIDVLREEAFEDISLMSSGAGASDEGIPPAFGAARLGWLLLALAVSMMVGIGALHLPAAERASVAAFALYLPLLIDLPISLSFRISSAASRRFEPGADTEAERALVREIEVGALIALLAAAAVFFCSLLTPAFSLNDRLRVAGSVVAGCSYAALCGIGLPFTRAKLGQDPAAGLRPLLVPLVSAGSVLAYGTALYPILFRPF